ncbi:hypothetical protein Taro_031170 [Colocasia esculenta]|uniref:Uncharacterized protein n=1 Tax=Colocasia esculenta TaxID=4460 RepID=A0A843VY99_COLES|nr:hypothetical protein [Colocasia esculenta]
MITKWDLSQFYTSSQKQMHYSHIELRAIEIGLDELALVVLQVRIISTGPDGPDSSTEGPGGRTSSATNGPASHDSSIEGPGGWTSSSESPGGLTASSEGPGGPAIIFNIYYLVTTNIDPHCCKMFLLLRLEEGDVLTTYAVGTPRTGHGIEQGRFLEDRGEERNKNPQEI